MTESIDQSHSRKPPAFSDPAPWPKHVLSLSLSLSLSLFLSLCLSVSVCLLSLCLSRLCLFLSYSLAPIHELSNQSINQLRTQSTKQSTKQPINYSIYRSINKPNYPSLDKFINQLTNPPWHFCASLHSYAALLREQGFQPHTHVTTLGFCCCKFTATRINIEVCQQTNKQTKISRRQAPASSKDSTGMLFFALATTVLILAFTGACNVVR